ncbi:hybrid sensor histidine kinase/response regulator transcription factor [Segatella paludivivens]|uniref:hybrid sensor histidine kinase/response regulator transcription factor n=1 Tax=Segatella paludivivens TaxID=185294 RepID=UPI000694A627|nr:hybrid sensor histidine kinase/response regulator transcription factor [Segatella paludivivens]
MKKLLNLLFLLFPIMSIAQSGKVFTVEKDLSNSNISLVYQDKSGFIWIGTDDGLNCYDGAKFRKLKHVLGVTNSLVDNRILSLVELQKGKIAIGTARGLQIYDKSTESFINVTFGFKNEKSMGAYVTSILVRKNGEILVATSGHGMYTLITNGDTYSLRKSKYNIRAIFINKIFEDRNHDLWLATSDRGIINISRDKINYDYQVLGYDRYIGINNIYQDLRGNIYVVSTDFGLAKLNKKARCFVVPEKWTNRIPVFCMLQVDDRHLYIGTIGKGVLVYDIFTGDIADSKIKFNTFDFGTSEVHSMLKDVYGNLWIGASGTGVVLLPKECRQFKYIGSHSINNDKIGFNRIISIFKDNASNLWLGTANDGLYKVSDKGVSTHYKGGHSVGMLPPFVSGILQDSNHSYWVASLVDGLFRFDPSSGKCINIPIYYQGKKMKGVTSIVEDDHKNLWIGVMGGGVFRWDMRKNKLFAARCFNGKKDNNVNDNALHSRWISTLKYYNGKLYIGTCDGLGCLDLKTDNFVNTFKKNRILAGVIIYVIYKDKLGRMWLGTTNGLIRLNNKNGKCRMYTMRNGLPSDAISDIQDDGKNGLWISTDYGLSHYNAAINKFVNFYSNDGLQSTEFVRNSSFADNKGNVYFGGSDGVTYFNVNTLKLHTKKPEIKLVGFYINDKSVCVGMKSGIYSITDKAVYETDRFDLAHTDNNITMELSAMDFYNAERISYAYSINGGHWNIQRAGVNRVTFNNLSPGKYHVCIKSIDGDASSDIKNITIVIHYPWYASWWAILIYILMFFIAFKKWRAFKKDSHKKQHELVERQQAENINEAKLQFFINIAHEIRTPMSLVISPLQQLMSQDKDTDRQRNYSIINRNAQRILRLINQLMDIRKIDKGQMTLMFSENDIIKVIDNVCGDFEQQMKLKNISLEFHHEMKSLKLWIDPSNFDKIIVNILSNALKFTPQNGNISITVETKDVAAISISDSGSKIDEKEIERIFGRFYQIRKSQDNSNVGTGIGLHLTRSLVELHHGDIHAENNINGPGCKFIIHLPLGHKHLRNDEIEDNAMPQQENIESKVPEVVVDDSKSRRKTKHYILVVEDEEEIRKYICDQLRPEFNTRESEDGKDAYQKILDKKPDLIISDVMMPEMNGFELCRKIRQNPNVNSVPIILLTAKTTVDDNIEGLELGADAYITKPFNMNLLRKTVENLISSREVLKNAYTGKQEQLDKITKLEAKSPDDKLMDRIMKVIDSNISNPDLNVEMITQEVGISRVHLYRKMKELTNQSMRDFIRNVRLKQAATLLSEKKYSVSEVVEMTGFTRVSNFSTLFKNMYGISPMAYRDAKHTGTNKSKK